MEAIAQICDAHLTEKFVLGTNFTGSSMMDTLKDVTSIQDTYSNVS